MKIVLGCVGTLVFVLCGTIVALLTTSPGDTEAATPVVATQLPSDVGSVEILIAKERIENGTQLHDRMFDSLRLPVERIPAGAVLAREQGAVIGLYANQIINPNMPVLLDAVSKEPPQNSLPIPPGFRAATLQLDTRAGAGGWATLNSRVDVLFNYRGKDGEPRVSTMIRFAKVLSFNGATTSDGRPASTGTDTITLLVTDRDAMKIELARSTGSLSLSRVGAVESVANTVPTPEIKFSDLTGGEEPIIERPRSDGYLEVVNPVTGRLERRPVVNGKLQAPE